MGAAEVKSWLWSLVPRGFRASSESDPETDAWLGWLAQMFATATDAAIAARRAWFPETCADDELALHGRRRGIPRHPGESAAVYRARLVDAWALKSEAGTVPGVERAIRLLGYPTATVYECYRDGAVARYDGTYLHNGTIKHGGHPNAFKFDVLLDVDESAGPAISAPSLALLLREVRRVKRAAAILRWVSVSVATSADDVPACEDEAMTVTTTTYHLHDGTLSYDGTVDYGPASEATQSC